VTGLAVAKERVQNEIRISRVPATEGDRHADPLEDAMLGGGHGPQPIGSDAQPHVDPRPCHG